MEFECMKVIVFDGYIRYSLNHETGNCTTFGLYEKSPGCSNHANGNHPLAETHQ